MFKDYKANTVRELVEQNQLYQVLCDKLDIPLTNYDKSALEILKECDYKIDFIETLFKTYDNYTPFPFDELNQCGIHELTSYIKRSHHYYLKKKLPEIELTALQVFKKYSDTYPLLSYLCVFFNDYKKQLVDHINIEERKLLPYIDQLLNVDLEARTSSDILRVLNWYSTREFISNHTHIEEDLQNVRKAILNYSNDSKAPLPFNVFLNHLSSFEQELIIHAKIEDEILIPKIIELEAHLLKKAASQSLTLNHFA